MIFRTLFYSVICFATCLHTTLLCESLPHPDSDIQDSFTSAINIPDVHDSIALNDLPEIEVPSTITAETELPSDTVATADTPSTSSELLEHTQKQPASEDFENLLALLASEQPQATKEAEITTPAHVPVQTTITTPQAAPAPKTPSAAEQKKAQLLAAIENRSKKNQSGIRKSPLFNLTSRPQQASPQFAMPHQPGALEQLLTGTFYTLLSAIVGGFVTQHGTDFVNNWWAQWSLKPVDLTGSTTADSNLEAIITYKDNNKNSFSLEEHIKIIVKDTLDRWNWQQENPGCPFPKELELPAARPFYAIHFRGDAGAGKTYLNKVMYGEIDKRLKAAGHPGVELYEYQLEDFASKWVGEGQRNLVRAFERAQASRKKGYLAAIFLDEVHGFDADKVMNNGSSENVNRDIIKKFKTCMTSPEYAQGIVFTSATNFEIKDEATGRRLGEVYYVNNFEKKDQHKFLLHLLTQKRSGHPFFTTTFATKACAKLPEKAPMDVLFRLAQDIDRALRIHNDNIHEVEKIIEKFQNNELRKLANGPNAIKNLKLAPTWWTRIKMLWGYWKEPYKDQRNLGANILNNPLSAGTAAVVLVGSALEKPLNRLGEKSEHYINNGWHYFNTPSPE